MWNDIPDINARVAWALKETGKSNEDLARDLEVSKNTIGAYKNGKGDLKGVVLVGLAEKYNFNPSWLLKGLGPKRLSAEDIEKERANQILGELAYSAPRMKEAVADFLPKSLDSTLYLKVHEVIAETIKEKQVALGPKKMGILSLLSYTDTFSRKKVSREYIEHLVDLARCDGD